MPLKKTASKKTNNRERAKRASARTAAKKKYGEKAIKGKSVHHKNGDNTDNRPSNLSVRSLKSHGKKHGRGKGKRGRK